MKLSHIFEFHHHLPLNREILVRKCFGCMKTGINSRPLSSAQRRTSTENNLSLNLYIFAYVAPIETWFISTECAQYSPSMYKRFTQKHNSRGIHVMTKVRVDCWGQWLWSWMPLRVAQHEVFSYLGICNFWAHLMTIRYCIYHVPQWAFWVFIYLFSDFFNHKYCVSKWATNL